MSAILWRTFFLLALSALICQGQEQSIHLQYSIYEETPKDSFVGDVRRDAQLQDKFTPEVFASLRYAILPQSSQYASYFSIDEVVGSLRTARTIDHDAICPQKEDCPITFDIALPKEHFQIIKITIQIDDINDNPPVFIDDHLSRPIPENTQPGRRFTIPAADDLDSPKFGVKRYELVTGAPQFALNVSTLPDGTGDLQLVLRLPLDRERRELYTLVIAAYDGGIPEKSGFLTVDMIILDVNDNRPKFDNDTYEVTVPENVSKNSVIIKLRARDSDALANGQVVYSFSSKTQAAFGSTFGIDNVTGEIYVKDSLDYEENTIYNLAVTANDKTVEALTGRAKVIVKIQDVNDHAPEITINALTSTGHVEISEGAAIDSFVAHISVADPDSGRNGQFTCSLASSYFDIQQMYQTEYKVVTTEALDRETAPLHRLTIVCKDQGVPSLTSEVPIPVTILDENDHAPKFTKSVYSEIIEENNVLGATIVQVNATDADAGGNARIEYRLRGDGARYINIDPLSGKVTARVSFDYEMFHKMEFEVIATDHGTPPKTDVAKVLLKITDTNDNNPEFEQDQYVFDVYENQPLGTEVGQVVAADADTAPYNAFMYFMDPGASDTENFVVEPQTGKIFTRQELDREGVSQFLLVVMAVSQENPSMQNSVRIIIHVADQNDNAPILLFPHPHNDTVYIGSRTPFGGRVAQILATDLDIGINARLLYQIRDDSDAGLFVINEQNGIISVKTSLADLGDKLFILKIQVSDSGSPQHKVESFLNVVVNKSLEQLPIMANQNLTIVVSVAVISAVLVIILTIAIILTKRQDKKGRKLKYVNQKVLQPKVLMMENGKGAEEEMDVSATEPSDNHINSRKEGSYSNNVDLADERSHTKYSAGMDQADGFITKGQTHYDPHASTYVALYGHPAPTLHGGLPLLSAAAASSSLPQQHSHGLPPAQLQGHRGLEAASPSFDRELKALHHAVPKDHDSDSTDSAASNADSGRGSNEDTDSRPSMNDSVTHGTDGVLLMPPLLPHSQSQGDNFKVRLSSLVKMQHDHIHNPVPQPSCTEPSRSSKVPDKPASRTKPSHRLAPAVPSTSCATLAQKQPHTKTMYPNELPHSHSGNVFHVSGQQQPDSHTENYPAKNSRLGSNSLPLNPVGSSEDESETDFSDEDREYVYYVNASHV